MQTVAMIVSFQVGWFASILGAAHGYTWLGPVIVAVVVFCWMTIFSKRRPRIRLIVLAGLVGFLVDTIFIQFGVIAFSPGGSSVRVSPMWMVGLWVQMALLTPPLLEFLVGRPIINAVLGAVAGPACYWGGARVGALEILEPLELAGFHYAILAGVWAGAFAGLMQLPQWKMFDFRDQDETGA